ncbi:hypothetical protein CW304_01135 [Bacillus sp. UFRGS-B20]|nr:hypothetical protein CW304_01135 [Bacillus sp. UFRGS-B20]
MLELRQEFEKLAQLKLTPTTICIKDVKPPQNVFNKPVEIMKQRYTKRLIIMENKQTKTF